MFVSRRSTADANARRSGYARLAFVAGLLVAPWLLWSGIFKPLLLGLGLFRTMPLTMVCGVIGALAISGFPLTSGCTTRTLISQAAADQCLVTVYLLLAAASAGVFLHAGIRFPWFVFFHRDSGLRPKDAPWNMAAAMGIFAGLSILLGVAPDLLYRFLTYPVDYEPCPADKVLFYLQLLLFSALAFFLLLPSMKRTETISLDFGWNWRVALYRAAQGVSSALARFGRALSSRAGSASKRLAAFAVRHLSVSSGAEPGLLARAWPIGTTALWIAVLLIGYVFVYYL